MGWIGLDDTDTLAGGCTTLVFHQLLEGLPSNIAVSEARLVRLWPFAKKRTRGNAAMAAELILLDDDANVIVDEERKDIATQSLLQHLDEWWNEHIAPLEGAVEQSTHNDRPQVPTEPGMVWFESQPDDSFYRMAVCENVEMEKVPIADRAWGSHGIIGATAAVSWPAQTVTWETIAWRDDCTSAREICERTLSVIDSWQGTFMSRDSRKGRSLIAPRGNCPVLFGVRARDKKTANNAAKKLLDSDSTQPSIGMRTFLTNQASDDHLGEIYIGKVISTKILSRGHVIITVQQNVVDDSNAEDEIAVEENTWMAFAQSGDIKNLAQWFQTGDVIKGRGLVAEDGAIHLEKLKLVEASERNKRRPPCERCGKTVKSQGKNNKLRCPACKNLQENIWIYNPQNPPHRGWVQPPVDHRRHLSRPLKWDQE